MVSDQNNGGNEKSRQDNDGLSNETIDQVKKGVLFGVGYRRPPEHTRFKKGQSGNPKGRPRTDDVDLGNHRSANTIALKEGERPISVREGTTTREMPAIDAVFRKQIATALGGSAYAQKHAIERYDRAERERRQKIAREIEIYTYYVETRRAEIAEAKAKGQSIPDPLPHPDDVVIDHEKGVRIIGPSNKDELARMEQTLKYRDTLLLQHALDQREVGNPKSEDILDRPGSAFIFAEQLNSGVPERFRLSKVEIKFKVYRYSVMPKRALLKELYHAWHAIGVPARRGATFPPIRFAKKFMENINQALDNPQDGA